MNVEWNVSRHNLGYSIIERKLFGCGNYITQKFRVFASGKSSVTVMLDLLLYT